MSNLARLTGVCLALICGPAVAAPGSSADPIVVHFRRGADQIHFQGVLSQGRDCCAYAFKARAGQTLVWRETGAAIRVTIRYPDGHIDGPGLPANLPLPSSGTYIFTVHPDLMADGAFGPFTLSLKIPPIAGPLDPPVDGS